MSPRCRLVSAVLGLALCLGCGHSVEPVAPYDSAAGIPPPRSLSVQGDPIGRLVVRWRATADDRTIVDGWFVERRVTTEIAFTRLETGARADTVYFDDDVADGLRYVYRVVAVTGAGVTGPPAESPAVRGDRTAPSTPSVLAAATAPGGVRLDFVPGGEPDLAFFEVRMTRTSTNLPPEYRAVGASPATIVGLVAGGEYAFEIAAIDSAGRSSGHGAPPVTAIAGP